MNNNELEWQVDPRLEAGYAHFGKKKIAGLIIRPLDYKPLAYVFTRMKCELLGDFFTDISLSAPDAGETLEEATNSIKPSTVGGLKAWERNHRLPAWYRSSDRVLLITERELTEAVKVGTLLAVNRLSTKPALYSLSDEQKSEIIKATEVAVRSAIHRLRRTLGV
jgi:hypothetical protein